MLLIQPHFREADRKLYTKKESEPKTSSVLDDAIARAEDTITSQQATDGHWVYELEADCTIPAEYILMMHFMDEIDTELQGKIACYLRDRQADHGGWPLYYGGAFDLSCSVKVYYALKIAGDDPQAPHMVKAREAILARGGASQCNVFTRITLALFEQLPWRGVPFIPVEIILLPKWFPFHISKVSYWSRTVMVPLFILCTTKPKAANPGKTSIAELFTVPPAKEKNYFHPKNLLSRIFLTLDHLGRAIEPLIPKFIRSAAIRRAETWFTERLNGEDGLGGIFPAMVNAHEALALLGYPPDHPYRVQTAAALKKLLVIGQDSAYCQPCLSPMWDTGLACHALWESAGRSATAPVIGGLDWLRDRQLTDEPGDWRENNPTLKGGAWPFQYANDYYPDLDDTSVIAWAMKLVDAQRYAKEIDAAAEWIHGMQSKNGGFGAFDRENTYYYLNNIPFADHGALLDPPTEDVTARCVALLAISESDKYRAAIDRAIAYLKTTQQSNGSWYGRWGTNYVYGTWSVLSALEVAGEDPNHPYIQRAVSWLKSRQHIDGGWGEHNDSYYEDMCAQPNYSTSFQTAWAVLALMSAGESHSDAVRRGINFLIKRQRQDGRWQDDAFTAPGFPRVFYLKYHGYTEYFPLWALAQYRNRQDTFE